MTDHAKLVLTFESFGYKGGVPLDADYVFDARCVLPNPHYDPQLRPLTGRDPDVIAFLERETQAEILIEDIQRFLQRWIPKFLLDQRPTLTVAIGCTGGRHRSVYIAEKLGERFASEHQVVVRHRDLKPLHDGPPQPARGTQACKHQIPADLPAGHGALPGLPPAAQDLRGALHGHGARLPSGRFALRRVPDPRGPRSGRARRARERGMCRAHWRMRRGGARGILLKVRAERAGTPFPHRRD